MRNCLILLALLAPLGCGDETPGPAAAAGVLVGDILLAFDGHPIGSPEDLLDLLRGDRVGKPAVLRGLRGGTAIDASVTVGQRPTQ